MYTIELVILEMVGYKINNAKIIYGQYPLASYQVFISQLSEQQKGALKKELPKKFNKLTILEAEVRWTERSQNL